MPTQNYDRTDRIGEEMRREIDQIIRQELRDPRVRGTYSITRVDVTRDLRFAKVRVSVLEPEQREPLLAALRGAAGFIRREVGKAIKLRYTPELLFAPDENIEYGIHIASVIDAVRKEEKDKSAEEDGDAGHGGTDD